MATTTRWEIDPAHTSVELAVKHMMFTTVRGRFKSVRGWIELDSEEPDRSRVHVEVDAASIDTGVDQRDAHLRSPDFLDAEHHPHLVFDSTEVRGAAFDPSRRFEVVGQLAIRGAPVQVTLEVTYEGVGKDPWGGDRAGFSAKAEIDRRDWGLRWNQALETGGVLVGNNVRVEIDAQAVRQQETRAAEGTDRGAARSEQRT